jgi:hypothetical protein
MSLGSGGRKLSFELLSSDLTADDVDDTSPRSLPETSSDGRRRRRRRRSKRKQGFQSPPIVEEEPRVDGSAAAAFRVTDLRSVVEKVCQSSDAEGSAASCVTRVGVELRQRSVAANGRLSAAASGDDATSSCGSSMRESVAAAAAAADVVDAARRPEANGVLKKLEKDESLDWEKFIKENSNILGGM